MIIENRFGIIIPAKVPSYFQKSGKFSNGDVQQKTRARMKFNEARHIIRLHQSMALVYATPFTKQFENAMIAEYDENNKCISKIKVKKESAFLE